MNIHNATTIRILAFTSGTLRVMGTMEPLPQVGDLLKLPLGEKTVDFTFVAVNHRNRKNHAFTGELKLS